MDFFNLIFKLTEAIKEAAIKYGPSAALGGGAGLKMEMFSQALGGVESVLKKIGGEQVKINAEDFSLFGSIRYWDEIIGKMSDTNQALGIAGNLGVNLKSSFKGAYASVVEMGITTDELAKSIQQFLDDSGKAQILSSNQMAELAKMSKVFGIDSLKIVETYGEMGIGITATTSRMRNLIKESDKFGLLPTKVSGILKNNLDKVNSYSFKNGVKALEQMAIYAAKTNTELKTAFGVADKILQGGIESTMEISSSLQLMGGAFGNMTNFAELTFLARNDPGKLQKMYMEAAASMAVFNEETKEFELSAYSMDVFREIANKTGADLTELVRGSKTLAKSIMLKDELDASVRGLQNFDELLTKVSGAAYQNDLGEWVVNIKEGGVEMQKAVSALSEEQIKQISFTDEKKGPEQAFEDIAKSNERLAETINRLIDTLKVQAISTGGYEKISEITRTAADNIKTLAQPFVEMYQDISKEAVDNFIKVIDPLSKGDFGTAFSQVATNLLDALNVAWTALKDIGQMLLNVAVNIGKLIWAGFIYLGEMIKQYVTNFFIDIYNMSPLAKVLGEWERYEAKDIDFTQILKDREFRNIFYGTNLEEYFKKYFGENSNEMFEMPEWMKNPTESFQPTSTTDAKKLSEDIEKKISTSGAEDKPKKVEVSFTNPIILNVLGNTSEIKDPNVITEEVKRILNVK